MPFPQQRLRRLRRTSALRRLVAETAVRPDDLLAPLFVREGIDEPQPIASLPGVVQHTRASLVAEVKQLVGLGIPGVILKLEVVNKATGEVKVTADRKAFRIDIDKDAMLPGIVSLWEPVAGPAQGIPYIVFAGNVGDDEALAAVVATLRAV